MTTGLRRAHQIACSTLLLAVLAGLTGCSTIHNHPTEGVYKQISFGAQTADGSSTIVRHFTASKRSSFWFFRLIPANKANIISIAEKQIGPNEGIVNLRATTKFDFIDFLITGFTFGIYHTWSIEVSGDVVKLQSL